MVSHLEVCLPKKPPTPKNIGDAFGGPQIKFRKEALFVQYEKNRNVSLLSVTTPIKPLPEGKTPPVHSLLLVLRKVTVLMHGMFCTPLCKWEYSD